MNELLISAAIIVGPISVIISYLYALCGAANENN